ncbi:MAG: hypothetical protein RLZ98_3788 [Pseudomonadota bacterium]|jgi:SAM-dependent methyltransferase
MQPSADVAPTDFDFMAGSWAVLHRRLNSRLQGCTEWTEFTGTSSTRKILRGFGNVEDNLLNFPEGSVHAVAVRSFDPKTKTWAIWWLDRRSPRHLDVPVVGKFKGRATSIPLGNASVDVVVSGLVLNFVPDQHAALLEMARVTGKGGTIAAYVWDDSGKKELMRLFWDVASKLDADAAKLDEGVRFPLCRPEALAELFASAGLKEVEVAAIDIPTSFANFDDYWQPFLGGQGPAPAYAMSLDESARVRLRDHMHQRLPTEADGSISLTARAWAARGSPAPAAHGGRSTGTSSGAR